MTHNQNHLTEGVGALFNDSAHNLQATEDLCALDHVEAPNADSHGSTELQTAPSRSPSSYLGLLAGNGKSGNLATYPIIDY
jgi:hypothetical protein